ncbi:hypothetical protein HOLleu_05022 [Holothuria leucospilota]|uniref:Uncharacterized protein n=1 Tax=Holothuria leucospilota TaxID=206669 RepID=A0A9Q1CJ92_HOLLE|nr:hypothetical protein HOLleu_05022 [Holothuria leucospilota]
MPFVSVTTQSKPYHGEEDKLKHVSSYPEKKEENGSIMAAFCGQLNEFQCDEEDWLQYTEYVENFFIANGIIDEGKQNSMLLSAIGSEAYKLI